MNYYTLINLPVFERRSGKKIGRLTDVLIYENEKRIFGMVATNKNVIYANRMFLRDDIYAVTNDFVIVEGRGEKFVRAPRTSGFISFKNAVENTKLKDEQKNLLGIVRDGYFDMEIGELTDLLIGHGFADDLIHGRQIVSVAGITKKDTELIAQRPELREKNRGIKRLLKD